MCRSCVDKLSPAACPACRRRIVRRKKKLEAKANEFAQHDVQQLRVKCLQHELGCGWTGQLGTEGRNLLAHCKVCPFKTVRCQRCGQSMSGRDFDAHRVECPKSIVRCCSCHAGITAKDIEQHFAPRPAVAAAGQVAPAADGPALRAPFHPLCTNAEVCPNRCEDPAHPGHLFACALSQRAAHASACPLRRVPCLLCEPAHSLPYRDLEAHVDAILTQPLKRKMAVAQIVLMCKGKAGRTGTEEVATRLKARPLIRSRAAAQWPPRAVLSCSPSERALLT